jgi:hypothetical protein
MSLASEETEHDGLAAESRRQRVALARHQPHIRAVVSIADAPANSLHQGDSDGAARGLLVGAAQASP